MDGTILQQGRFTSDGTAQDIAIRSDVDWIEVVNETQYATTQGTGRGVKFEWQRGMADGHAYEVTKADNTNVMQAEKVTSGGFTLIDPNAGIGAAVTGTTITKADPPVCTAAGHGYSNGDNILLSNLTNMPQLGGFLFEIGSVATNTFELTYLDTNTANFTQEAAFEVRRLPAFSWNNSWIGITAITSSGTSTLVTTSSTEAEVVYGVGDVLKFKVPSQFGMVEINGLEGEITAYNSTTNIYTVDINSSAFTAFAWPASTAVPMEFPQVNLVGNVATGLVNSTNNTSDLIIRLGSGIDGPAGSTSDVIYWRAGKSFAVSNS